MLFTLIMSYNFTRATPFVLGWRAG